MIEYWQLQYEVHHRNGLQSIRDWKNIDDGMNSLKFASEASALAHWRLNKEKLCKEYSTRMRCIRVRIDLVKSIID